MNSKKIIYIDMDGVLCDFDKAKQRALAAKPENAYPQSEHGFFANLEPIDGAIDAAKSLIESDKYDVYILTAPSYKNPLCYSEKRVWIEKYFGLAFCRNLMISAHKNLSRGDYLIDDNNSGCGQDKFEGELIHFGHNQFKDWKSVTAYLLD